MNLFFIIIAAEFVATTVATNMPDAVFRKAQSIKGAVRKRILKGEKKSKDVMGEWGYDKLFKEVTKKHKTVTPKTFKSCFPGDAEVLTPAGNASISEIKVGDQVATAITKNGDLHFETVYLLGHDDGGAYAPFYRFEMEPMIKKSGNGSDAAVAVVEMSPLHFVPVLYTSLVPFQQSELVNTRAKAVSLGDIILALSQDEQALLPHIVTKKGLVMNYGLYNPYTLSGRILVNNVSVTTHSEWRLDPFFGALGLTSWLPEVHQIILSPLRVMVYVLGPNLYAKTSIASRLTEAITGGSNKETEAFPTWTVTNMSVPLFLLVAIWFLAQRKGKIIL